MKIIPTGRVTPRYNGSTLSRRQRRMAEELSKREKELPPERQERIKAQRQQYAEQAVPGKR